MNVFACMRAATGFGLQALDLDGDYLTHLNYAVTLLNNDEPERATEQFASFKKLFEVFCRCRTTRRKSQRGQVADYVQFLWRCTSGATYCLSLVQRRVGC